jgi:hypothetical protein
MCLVYVQWSLREQRRGYKDERRTLVELAKDLERIRQNCQELGREIDLISERVREAHIPLGSPVPFMYALELRGPLEFFIRNSLPDPASGLAALSQAISDADKILVKELKRLKKKAPRIKALWKEKPVIAWQKGGFEYVLQQIFRFHLRLTIPKAHKRIIEIRRKLMGDQLRFDSEKGNAPAISRIIERMPGSYRLQCDRVIARILPPTTKA